MDIQIESLYGELTATSAECPLTLQYAGDEPYYEGVKGWPTTAIVQVHAWSSTKDECLADPLTFTGMNNAVWVCPNFGGLNNQPQGAGHPAQLERIHRVIMATKEKYPMIERILMVGKSGGGYVALMYMAAYPGVVYGASLWCFINDLAQWYAENPNHRGELEACIGGTPTQYPNEYYARSPASRSISGVKLHLNGSDEDTEVLFHHQTDAKDHFSSTNDVTFRNYSGGHIIQYDVATIQLQSMQP